jgi:Flp pilus assembly secretin CpaC
VKKHSTAVAMLVVALLAFGVAAGAQEPSKVVTALRIQVVVSKYQGEKKVSSLPYTLTVNAADARTANNRASLRMGAQLPIVTMARAGGNADAPLTPTVQYRDVGTSIDCTASARDDGQFKLDLNIEDSSVDAGQSPSSTSSHPAFRSFRSSNTLLLKDGQSTQFTTATDKVSGEVVKVDVTLTVVK